MHKPNVALAVPDKTPLLQVLLTEVHAEPNGTVAAVNASLDSPCGTDSPLNVQEAGGRGRHKSNVAVAVPDKIPLLQVLVVLVQSVPNGTVAEVNGLTTAL